MPRKKLAKKNQVAAEDTKSKSKEKVAKEEDSKAKDSTDPLKLGTSKKLQSLTEEPTQPTQDSEASQRTIKTPPPPEPPAETKKHEVMTDEEYQALQAQSHEPPPEDCWTWLLKPRPQPPKRWEHSRRKELQQKIHSSAARTMLSETMRYRLYMRRELIYHGEFGPNGERDGRGCASWPDPPRGGGESYFGLWRHNFPKESGVFCWYDGDVYYGEFGLKGVLQGVGCYHYGELSVNAGDVYCGNYNEGLRTGSGVYSFSANGTGDNAGAVYKGEFLKGKMNGLGVLAYADGEVYAGQWIRDLKHGLGSYTWGGTTDVAGDRYVGYFKEGHACGYGCTTFIDGGFHRGEYANGKMNGWGVLRETDGSQYMGKWVDDEMDGEILTYNAYQALKKNSKSVQTYRRGEFISEREYKSKDYLEIEITALEGMMHAEQAEAEAVLIKAKALKASSEGDRALELAMEAKDKALYWANSAVSHYRHVTAWFGIKALLIDH